MLDKISFLYFYYSKKIFTTLGLVGIYQHHRVFLFSKHRDKHKDFGILLGQFHLLKYGKGVNRMVDKDTELLNTVYKEIADRLGMDIAMDIYKMFKGQQISFPVRFLNPARIQRIIIQEYDGTNIKALAVKYNYSEKTVRRIIRDSVED